MDTKTINEILDKHYAPGVRKAVAKMKRDAKRLEKQLEKDPNNMSIAVRCAMNPFCTTVEADFMGICE